MKGRSALPRAAFLAALLAVPVAVVGAIWGPQLLARAPYFDVRKVEVVGTELVAPDSVLVIARIDRERSVWEAYDEVEARVEQHPLVERARVHRQGWHGLRVVIDEVEPVALVGVPDLRPVRGDGSILAVSPTRVAFDLPILTAAAEPTPEEPASLKPGAARRALETFNRLRSLDPGLAAAVSDFGPGEPTGIVANLTGSLPSDRLALPESIDEALVRRLRAALTDLRARNLEAAVVEARYAGQIVVRLRGSQSQRGREL